MAIISAGFPGVFVERKISSFVRIRAQLWLARPSGMKPENFFEALGGRDKFPPIAQPEARMAARRAMGLA